ncbi:pilus assembly protein [Acetobacter estunensis NRIC 0472]|uniref:AAA family ATPase n=1 Tax=Acetobacter estunensis TaxID=104097 RepID=A0A967B5S9_9PROT|nr:AAA family ATPase [Acetobacter estunensis]NHO54335.1 AAA family ATPase [Acetobacter estunensis]GBQ21274.1 pilus assembly protein [Acetobacter estunensis NRIC 0472]
MSQFRMLDLGQSFEGAKSKSSRQVVVQAFVADVASENILREILDEFQPGNYSIACQSCSVATSKLRKGATPKILIIDVSGEDQPLTALGELANVIEPDVKVLVIGDRQDANFYRQLTRGLGVAEYLYKPLNRAMVTRFFGPFLADGDFELHAARGGRVIGFLGVRGGVGTTTIASNFAWYLGEVARRHTLIIDGDLYTGSVSILLGTRVDGGLKTAFEAPQRVDELFIERSAQRVGARCDVLGSQINLTDTLIVDERAPFHLIDVVKKKYNYIAIDMPGLDDEISRKMLELCEQNVLVMDPTLSALRDALRFVASIKSQSKMSRPLIVLNKFGIPGSLSLKEISDGFGRPPDVIIPFTPKILNESEISGCPAASLKGNFRSSIGNLSQEAASVMMPDGLEEKSFFKSCLNQIVARFRP